MKFGTSEIHLNKRILVYTIIATLLFLGCRIVMRCSMPPLEDIYFSSFDNQVNGKVTVIYKYDARMKTVYELGQVEGHFYNCKIDSDKRYILGFRNASPNYPNEEKEIPGVEFGVVKFSLSDGTSEVVLSDKEMHELAMGDIRWEYSFPFGDEGKVFLHYYDSVHSISTDIVYDIETKKNVRMAMADEIDYIYDIKNNIEWYREKKEGRGTINSIIEYNLETGERKRVTIGRSITNCSITGDGTKIAYVGYKSTRIYLYDVNRRKEKCIIKARWNRLFDTTTFYGSEWDRSGNYYCYIEYFPWYFLGKYDIRLKVYNVQTRRSQCIYIDRRAPGSINYEFIKNADYTSEESMIPMQRILFELSSRRESVGAV